MEYLGAGPGYPSIEAIAGATARGDATPVGQIGSDLAKGLRLAIKIAAPLPRQSD
jgi:hypothetical protein